MNPHPPYFWQADRFYDWHTGLEVAATRTRTRVRVFALWTRPGGLDFYTWIDDTGERAWEVA